LTNAELSRDGERVFATYVGGTSRIFPTPSADRLVEIATRSLTRCLTAAQRESFGLSVPSTAPADRHRITKPPC
jgi:hypothetical protein